MKLFLALVLTASLATRAEVALKGIHTASDTTLVALFESRNVTGPVWNRVNQTNEVDTSDLSAWKLNGQPVSAIEQFVTPSEFCDYHIFLHVGKLVNGAACSLQTLHGSVGADDPSMRVCGGYHDAGDSDRLMYHMMVPTVLLTTFMSYLLQTNRPTDPAAVSQFRGALKATADKEIAWLNSNAYPYGWAPDTDFRKKYNYGQGHSTVQGQLAYPCLMQWALSKEQKYLDAVCQLMDYIQGLNPLGKCYTSGIGADPVRHPHDRESVFAQAQGWGPRPGLIVYGCP